MIISAQIRAARVALRWSVDDLASESGVSVRTIKRMEAADGVPNSTFANLKAVRTALEVAGVEFTGTPEDRPGVIIAHQRS
ncbi:helix-turn-helix domain-containing protein [Maritimibacter sp. DP07]|uniref:Helix-turn-helix domain-containing protein n=1 Tax=Maritimibacter harenae TaxID=2606218 RepID=A0A845M715_9RHOB|nr:helix-turn-helix domain-containing protein [Maritimibacter harenae]MZR15396.1 helix-turn-helix domain-containing protein [Maritimibacter harenae]